MDTNDTIAQLATKLDQWLADNHETFGSNDRPAQVAALRRGLAIDKEINQITTKGLASLSALLKGAAGAPVQDRAASFVNGIRFGARLAHTLHDELGDTTAETKVVGLMHDIVDQLDEFDPARISLLPLLTDPDAGVRAYAGAYLIKLMPDRVIPILRDIEEKENANSAHFTAFWAREMWERARAQTAM